MTEEGKEKDKIKVLLVSNISMSATKDQVFTMFQYVGRIEEMKVCFSKILFKKYINST